MSTFHTEPDLVIVVADADAEQLLASLLRRATDRRCLRPINWIIRRDPMRDSALCQHPTKSLVDIKPAQAKVLVVFDHHGSGREQESARTVEEHVVSTMVRSGFEEANVACVVLEPELECILGSVWDRLAEILAKRRSESVPPIRDVLIKAGLHSNHPGNADQHSAQMLIQHPKECLDALLRLLRLRHEPALFGDFGRLLSLPELKGGAAAARIAATLIAWFGIEVGAPCAPPPTVRDCQYGAPLRTGERLFGRLRDALTNPGLSNHCVTDLQAHAGFLG